MFLSFCSALFSSPVSIQWLCLFLTIPLFRFNPSDVYRTTLKMIKSIWFTRQFISYQKKMTLWQVLKLSKKFNLVNFFFRSRIAELCFSDAWQFTNYRETIISSLIHIGFVVFVWLQKTAVLSSYNTLSNSGPENAYTELHGVSGLPISLKYLGVKPFHPTLPDMLTR